METIKRRGGFRKNVKPKKAKYWDETLTEHLLKFTEQPKTVRFGPFMTIVRTHYLPILVKESGKVTGITKLCLNWDPETGEELGVPCPYCEFEAYRKDKKDKNKKVKFKPFYPSDNYYGLALDRTVQRKTKESIFAPCRMPQGLAQDIRDSSNLKFSPERLDDEELIAKMGIDFNDPDTIPDATDLEWGYDITVKKTQDGKKTKYVIDTGDTKPLRKDELAAFAEAEDRWNIAQLAKDGVEDVEHVRKELERFKDPESKVILIERNTNEKLSFSDGSASVSGSSSRRDRHERIPDDDSDDSDDTEQRTSLTGPSAGGEDADDDVDADDGTGYDDGGDVGEGDKEEKPKPAPAKPASKQEYDIDDDDDDDDDAALTRQGAAPDTDGPEDFDDE